MIRPLSRLPVINAGQTKGVKICLQICTSTIYAGDLSSRLKEARFPASAMAICRVETKRVLSFLHSPSSFIFSKFLYKRFPGSARLAADGHTDGCVKRFFRECYQSTDSMASFIIALSFQFCWRESCAMRWWSQLRKMRHLPLMKMLSRF